VKALRDSIEPSPSSSLLCNSSAKSITRGDESGTITEEKNVRRRGKEFRDSELFEKKRKKSPIYFRISKRINTKQNQFKDFRRFKSNLRIKPGKITNLPLRFIQEQQRIPDRCRSVRIQRVLVQNRKTLRFSRKPSRFQGSQRISIVVNQRINEQKHLEKRFEPKIEQKPFEIRRPKSTIYVVIVDA